MERIKENSDKLPVDILTVKHSVLFAGRHNLEARKCFINLMEYIKEKNNMARGEDDRYCLYTRDLTLFKKISSLQEDVFITSRNENILEKVFENPAVTSLKSWILENDEVKARNILFYNPISDTDCFKDFFTKTLEKILKALSCKAIGSKETLWIIIDDIMSLNELTSIKKIMKESRYRNIHLILYCSNAEDIELKKCTYLVEEIQGVPIVKEAVQR